MFLFPIPPHRGGGPAGWRGYSSLFRPIGEGDPQGGGGIRTLPVASRHPSVGGELYRPIPPQSGPAKLQNFVGDTWGGGPAGWRGYSVFITLPVASRHPSVGGESHRHDENLGAVRRRNHRVFINNKACFRVHNYSTQMRRRNRVHRINTNRRYINP